MGQRALFAAEDLVKNADENWPTAVRAFPEVIAVHPLWNRDDFHVSPTE
ncbi:hypothetical protein [Streptomyces spinoverrucosus]|nr:hypothetical protein [Streptomyces spinoverrucosus]